MTIRFMIHSDYRARLNGWLVEMPEVAQKDLVPRFRKNESLEYQRALAELTVHAVLKRQGYTIDVHPTGSAISFGGGFHRAGSTARSPATSVSERPFVTRLGLSDAPSAANSGSWAPRASRLQPIAGASGRIRPACGFS